MALISCPECGKERVSDSAITCPACGFGIREYYANKKRSNDNSDNENGEINKTQKVVYQVHTDSSSPGAIRNNRNALVLYLQNVRDLEVIKYRLNSLILYERDRYERKISQYPTLPGEYPEEPKKGFGYALCAVAIVWTIFWAWALYYGIRDGLVIATTIVSIFVVIGVFYSYTIPKEMIAESKEYEKAVERYQKNVEIANNNKSIVKRLVGEWEKKRKYYQNELNKVNDLLNKFYHMNIIPKPYRDNSIDRYRSLATACYLYDFMSSGQESYEMALISNQIEDGIRRIEAKLDKIIQQLNNVIYQQRVMNDQNRQFINSQIDQNNQMIDSIKRMESSQRNIEEYSRLSANYNAAQAFISMAHYLK